MGDCCRQDRGMDLESTCLTMRIPAALPSLDCRCAGSKTKRVYGRYSAIQLKHLNSCMRWRNPLLNLSNKITHWKNFPDMAFRVEGRRPIQMAIDIGTCEIGLRLLTLDLESSRRHGTAPWRYDQIVGCTKRRS